MTLAHSPHRPHLLIALSSHGFGHLSQAAPVINQLRTLIPELRITVRSQFSVEQIKRRIFNPDTIEPFADDFGMVMHHALSVDVGASLSAYLNAHNDWQKKVADLAAHLREIEVDLVVSDIPYLTLVAAQYAGIPSVALCSLNWADILEYYLKKDRLIETDPQGDLLAQEQSTLINTIRSAYQAARYFLQPAPSMIMPGLKNTLPIGPVCTPGEKKHLELRKNIGLPADALVILVGMGGMAYPLNLDNWPSQIDNQALHYLVPEEIVTPPVAVTSENSRDTDEQTINTISNEQTGLTYSELVASVDLIITKPGYGMFVEAAAAGVPVLYVERPGWPEAEALTSWLRSVAHCAEISSETLQQGLFGQQLTELLNKGPYPAVPPSGNLQAAELLQRILLHNE